MLILNDQFVVVFDADSFRLHLSVHLFFLFFFTIVITCECRFSVSERLHSVSFVFNAAQEWYLKSGAVSRTLRPLSVKSAAHMRCGAEGA